MMSPAQLLLVTAVVGAGAALQGSIGFGLGLMAAPLLVLIEPRLVPAPLLLASGVLTVLLTHRERHAIITNDLKWSLGGRVLGTLPALAVLTVVPADRLGLAFGALVLLGVGLTASGWHLPPSPRVLLGAGALSGFMATTVAIGGPPMERMVVAIWIDAGVTASQAASTLSGRRRRSVRMPRVPRMESPMISNGAKAMAPIQPGAPQRRVISMAVVRVTFSSSLRLSAALNKSSKDSRTLGLVKGMSMPGTSVSSMALKKLGACASPLRLSNTRGR